MKNICLIFFSLILFCSCVIHSDDPIEVAEIKNKKYAWISREFSDNVGLIAINKNCSIKNGEITAAVSEGKGTGARSNLSCHNLGMDQDVTGINLDLYCNSFMQSAGIQWWENKGMSSTRFYWIYFDRYGNFGITKKDINGETNKVYEKGVAWIPAKDTNIRQNEWNNITAGINSDNDFVIYTNGHLVYTIEEKDLMYHKGNFFIVYTSDPKTTYSENNKGIARFRLHRQQKRKE